MDSKHRIRFSAGWGTYLTNDFRDCNPHSDSSFNPVSLVCKLSEVDGRPAVKLSDNYQKAMALPRNRALSARLRLRRHRECARLRLNSNQEFSQALFRLTRYDEITGKE